MRWRAGRAGPSPVPSRLVDPTPWRAVSGRAEVDATEHWRFCEPVRRQAGFFEKLEDPGYLVLAGWSDGEVRHGLSAASSSLLMRAWISFRAVLKTSRRSSSLPCAREGSWNDQCRRFSAPGKTGQASLASS
jgi:hypothetical protein